MRDPAGDLAERLDAFGVRRALLGRLPRRHLLAHAMLKPYVGLPFEIDETAFGIDVLNYDWLLLVPRW